MATAALVTGVSLAAGTVGVAAPYKQQSDLFKQQINQDRRFFVADWAESSWRHSEALAQGERHHAEDYALNLSQYWQQERCHRREFLQGMLTHQREVDIALRAETREGLRDELLFQNNRMNNVQLCTTVCLGVSFSMVVEGILPAKSNKFTISMYAVCIGCATFFLTISLWLSFILIRRLNLYTAGIMHAMIEMEMSASKKGELADFDPVQTNEEFKAWLNRHCVWLRTSSIFSLSVGVVMLFISSGILLHARFVYNFEEQPEGAIFGFWAFALLTIIFISVLELREDRQSKQKRGVYSMSWKDLLRTTSHRFHTDAEKLMDLSASVRDELHTEVEKQELGAFSQAPAMSNVVSHGNRYSQLAVDRRLMRGKTRGVIYDAFDVPSDTWTPEEVKMQLRDVLQEVRNLDEQHAVNVDQQTKKQIAPSLYSAAASPSDSAAAAQAAAEAEDAERNNVAAMAVPVDTRYVCRSS